MADPPFAVQTNDGKWRCGGAVAAGRRARRTRRRCGAAATPTPPSRSRPAFDADRRLRPIRRSSGVWTVSKPLPVRRAPVGSSRRLDRRHDDRPERQPRGRRLRPRPGRERRWTGPLITRQGHLVRDPGRLRRSRSTLWGADWKLKAGHRIGVRVTDNNQDWWLAAVPSAPDRSPSTADRSAAVPAATAARRRSRATRASSSRAYLATQIVTAPAAAVATAVHVHAAAAR